VKPSYTRGFAMQASLALASALLDCSRCGGPGTGVVCRCRTDLCQLPYTVFVILPVNKRLETMPAEAASTETRALIKSGAIFMPCEPRSASPPRLSSCGR